MPCPARVEEFELVGGPQDGHRVRLLRGEPRPPTIFTATTPSEHPSVVWSDSWRERYPVAYSYFASGHYRLLPF